MAGILGSRVAADTVFAVGGMSASGILNFQNRNGLNPQRIIEMAATAAGAANEAAMARWDGITYLTESDHARYRQGSGVAAARTKKLTEASHSEPRKGPMTGHMLPIWDREYSLAWTEQYLLDCYQDQVDADIMEQVSQFQYDFEADVVTRLLSNAENSFAGGYDVGWAIGTGMTVNFIPPTYQTYVFDSTHTHFQFHTGTTAADYKALRDQMMKELRHHGLRGVLVQLISEADVDAWAAVDGFVEITPANIATFAAPSSPMRVQIGSIEGVPGELIGVFRTNRGIVEIRTHDVIPTGYTWMGKSFGRNNPENGLVVRVHPNVPFGMTPNPQVDRSLQPRLDGIRLNSKHGIGVNKRINGVAGQINASSYTAPSIA